MKRSHLVHNFNINNMFIVHLPLTRHIFMYSILKQDFFGVQLTLNNLFFKKDKRVNVRAYTND